MKSEEEFTVKEVPFSEAITQFCKNICGKDAKFNENATWLPELEDNYCINTISLTYEINEEITNTVMQRMPNNKAPGFDLITMFWFKKLTASVKPITKNNLKFNNNLEKIPQWLATTRTTIIPKNHNTKDPKNYRPIACENNQFKIYTGTIAYFLNEHCLRNKIIYPEQAANRLGSWGCVDQLFINKNVMEEISKHHRSAFCMWLDYRKAYDSISHEWLIKCLELAKVPPELVKSIDNLTKLWEVKISLRTQNETVETEKIKYSKGLLQGDLLSVILFLLCLNPLSHLINQCSGYKMGKPGKRDTEITHLFFVDDLKLFAKNENDIKQQMSIITEFSKDIGMSFGEDKCAYIKIEKGKQKLLGKPLIINEVKIQELSEEKTYKYLGLDESVLFDASLNKENISKEYIRRIRKIWSSELNSFNKILATNAFAVPIVTYSFGILDWTKEDLKQLNINTRKTMNMNRSINRRSDIHRLYLPRNLGGRGLRNIEDEYLSRIPTYYKHLLTEKNNNRFVYKILTENNIIESVATSICETYQIDMNDTDLTPIAIAVKIKNELKKFNKGRWFEKPIHGYLPKKQEQIPNVDKRYSYAWLKSNSLTSEVENYICTLQEQEIYTNARRKLHETNLSKKENIDAACRLCKKNDETVEHILTACPQISSSLYLEVRHNYVAELIYKELTKIYKLDYNGKTPQRIVTNETSEIWWDEKVKLPTGVKHNKPDIIVWNKEEKECQVIDISTPADRNINTKIKEKYDHYYPFISELQRVYPNYRYKIIPIVSGALGLIPDNLEKMLKEIGLMKTDRIIKEIQKRTLIGSLKIAKTFMKMI